MAVTVPLRATAYRRLDEVEVPAASNRLGLLAFIRDRLESPLRILDPDAGLQAILDDRWRSWCKQYEVDGEIPFVDEYGYLELWDGLRPDAMNIDSWYSCAGEEFAEQVGNFSAPFSLPSQRPKHYPPPAARTQEDLRRASTRGESVLAFGLGPRELGMLARGVEPEFFDDLWGGSKYRGAVDCLTTVGFVDEKPTRYLAVEWTPQAVHAYPVSEQEAVMWSVPRTHEWTDTDGTTHTMTSDVRTDDSLQGFARLQRADNDCPTGEPGPESGGQSANTPAALVRTWPYDGQIEI